MGEDRNRLRQQRQIETDIHKKTDEYDTLAWMKTSCHLVR